MIGAEYNNGILEVRLPVETGATVTGTEIGSGVDAALASFTDPPDPFYACSPNWRRP